MNFHFDAFTYFQFTPKWVPGFRYKLNLQFTGVPRLFGMLVAFSFLFSCKQQAEQNNEPVTQVEEAIIETDPLPSWNNGKTKDAIISFVEDVTDGNSQNFIPEIDRIATIDNDGTLWSEQPLYFQIFFTINRIKKMAPEHPEWKNKQPYKALLENDMPTLLKLGDADLLNILMTTHTGVTTEEFEGMIREWITTSEHPVKKRPYTDLVFQPMLELLDFLRNNNFKTFIVSGGGIEFMRPWAEEVYGVPKNQIIGSSVKTEYRYNDGKPTITKLPEVNFVDDIEGKPVGINRFIGRKPVFAVGNSDGDLDMLRWTDSNKFKTLKLYVHHTDSIREWSYDRKGHIGTLDKGLDEALEKGWTLIDMKSDWKVIYPFEVN